MAGFQQVVDGFEGAQYADHASQQFDLGQLMVIEDRLYHYVEMGDTASVAGSVYQSEVPGANFDGLVVAAAVTAGSREVTLTNGATVITADDFIDGYLNIEDEGGATPSEGRAYKIGDNDGAAASATVTLTLKAAGGVNVALTTSATCTLVKHPVKDAIIHLSPPTAAVVGLAVNAITAAQFGWFQLRGVSSVLIDGTVVIARKVMASNAVDGAVEPQALAEATPPTQDDYINLGICIEVAPTGEHGLIALDVPGFGL